MSDRRCICGHHHDQHEGDDWCEVRHCPCQRFESETSYHYDDDDDEEFEPDIDLLDVEPDLKADEGSAPDVGWGSLMTRCEQ